MIATIVVGSILTYLVGLGVTKEVCDRAPNADHGASMAAGIFWPLVWPAALGIAVTRTLAQRKQPQLSKAKVVK